MRMMERAVCDLTGEGTVRERVGQVVSALQPRAGKAGPCAIDPAEKIVIKPNWVGMIWREGSVDPDTYTLVKRQDYMNTAPQMIIALLRQLVGVVGVAEADISVCDSLAYLVSEYYDILHREFPNVQYVDYAGKFGRDPGPAFRAAAVLELSPAGRRPGLRARSASRRPTI